jgi:antirestriction protein ArdC
MKVEEVKQITTKALEELAASLESGHSESLTRYLKTMALFSKYSLNNLFLIARQRPDARRVAGYETWRKLGRFVRKGEKGIAIIAPMMRRKPETETAETTEEASVVRGFKVAHVFSEEQTEGQPLPEIGHMAGDPGGYLSRLEQFVRENGIELQYSHEIAPARGMAEKGKITLLPEQPPADTFATLVHEVAHSEMHFGRRRSETTKRMRETEAESVAYVVCSAIGLETGTAAEDYVGLYGGDAKLLFESLQYIQQTANRILTAITPENPPTPA